MALADKFLFLLARSAQKTGGLGNHALRALKDFMSRQSTAKEVQEPLLVVPANAISETSQTLRGSSGRLYFVRLVSPAAANDDAVVSFFDNAVLRFAVRLKQTETLEVPIFSPPGGIEFDTNLTVTGKKADNSTNLDAGDRPTLEVLVSPQT